MRIVVFKDGIDKNLDNMQDNFTYVNNVEEAAEALIDYNSNLLVVENQNCPLQELFMRLNQIPRTIYLLLPCDNHPYYRVADNSLNTAFSYHIPMKKKLTTMKQNIKTEPG